MSKLQYLREKLLQRNTYIVAFIVGTFINLYGQFLVPWLRGYSRPWQRFNTELIELPELTMLSVVLGYVFPFMVGIYSSVATRASLQHLEMKALFPDQKPDPVFRAAQDGSIVESGLGTQRLFEEREVSSAQAVLGADLWQQLVESAREGATARGTKIYSDALGSWYFVSHSRGPAGTVNVYLTEVGSNDNGSMAA